MDFNEFATDENAEENGKWFKLSATAEVKLRSYQSKKSLAVREALEEPYLALKRANKSIPAEDQERMLIEQMAKAILVDWKGFEEDGVTVPFSAKKALEVLTKYREFRNVIARLVADDDAFKLANKVEAEKN